LGFQGLIDSIGDFTEFFEQVFLRIRPQDEFPPYVRVWKGGAMPSVTFCFLW
jgi:hypothetical protein